jgi:hypothetical protein
MKIKVKDEDGIELSAICRQLQLKISDRKMKVTGNGFYVGIVVLHKNN